jgi:hypothetical protein
LDDQPLMLRDEGTEEIYALEWQTPFRVGGELLHPPAYP